MWLPFTNTTLYQIGQPQGIAPTIWFKQTNPMSNWSINQIGKAIQQGAVIAYPTDTVWGLGCDPLNFDSITRLLRIKQRPLHKGLILLARCLDDCKNFIDPELTPTELEQLNQTGEHPITWLIPASQQCPFWLRGDSNDIAIRISKHAFIQKIGQRLKLPLVSTSVNRSGQRAMDTEILIRKNFYHELDYIVSGYKTGKKIASEIKSLRSGKTIRAYQST